MVPVSPFEEEHALREYEWVGPKPLTPADRHAVNDLFWMVVVGIGLALAMAAVYLFCYHVVYADVKSKYRRDSQAKDICFLAYPVLSVIAFFIYVCLKH